MKYRLLVTTAFCGMAFIAATPAFAACDIHSPASGETVTCSVSDTVPVSAPGSAGVILNIDPNTAINTSNQLYFDLGDNATVNIGANATLQAPAADGASVGANSTINIGAGASLTSGNRTIDVNGTGVTINIGSGATVGGPQGIVYNIGGAGTMAVSLDGTLASMNSNAATATLTLLSGYSVTGNAVASAGGGDTLVLGGTSNGAFNTADIGGAAKFRNFDVFQKSGSSTWTLSGTNAQNWSISGGTLAAAYNNAGNISGTGGTFQITNASGSQQNFAGDITGGVGVLKSGGDFIRLTGNNSFTGALTVNNNTTLVLEDAAAASATSGISIDSSTLQFDTGFNGVTYDRNFDIGVNDATFATGANSFTLSGVINGAAGHDIGKTGSGTLTFTNVNNAYAGQLSINAGAVTGTSGEALGDGIINIGGAGTLNVTGGGTLSNALTGSGAFVKNGGAALTLTGNNSGFTGAMTLQNSTTMTLSAANNISGISSMTIDQSTLGFSNSFSSDRAFAIGTNDATFDTGANNVTLSGAITGGAGHDIVKAGTGTLMLSSTSNAFGDLLLNAGTVSVNAASNLSSGTLRFNGGTLNTTAVFNPSNAIVLNAGGGTIDTASGNNFTGNITGTGSLTKTGTGAISLSGTNTFSGALNINGGQVDALGNTSLGDGSGTNIITLNGGILRYQSGFTNARNVTLNAGGGTFNTNTNNVTMSGVISGAGALTKDSTGTLTLTNTNTNSGAINLVDGTISVSASANLGDGSANNDLAFNGGTLRMSTVFDQTRDIAMTGNGTISFDSVQGTITGNLSGAGTLTKDGTGGTLVIAGDHTHTGNLAIASGAIALEDATDRTYGGVISGSGNFSKGGAGTLILTNTGTITGTTGVYGGKLVVNGSLASATSFFATGTGTTLGGSGTVRNADFATGTILAPGNSIGTMHVTGTLALNNGSHYRVEYDPTSADNTIATGAITLGASSVLDLVGGAGVYDPTRTYTILQGASVTGTFGTVNNNLAFIDPTLIYNAADVQLTMTRNGTDFADIAEDESQGDTADAVADLGPGNEIFDAFSGLTADQARDALDQLSGEHNAGVAGAMAESSGIIQSALTSHMTGLTHGGDTGNRVALGFNASETGIATGNAYNQQAAWVEAIGTTGSSDAQGSAASQDRSSYGMLAGYDVAAFDDGYAGVFGGYERGSIDTDSENASSDLNNYHLGVYATGPTGGVNISGGIGATYHDIETDRLVSFPGFNERPHGDTEGYTVSGFAEVSKSYDAGAVALEPFANFSLTYCHMDGYTETGGGAANLDVDSVSNTNPATTLGFRTGKSVKAGEGTINLTGSLGWQHVYGDIENKSQMRFAGGTTNFDAFGPDRARDAAVVGLGVDTKVGTGMKAYAGYDGTLSGSSQDHGFKAGLKWEF